MIKIEDVQDKVLQLRNENVIIDSDVATLYGVETREINQAVKNKVKKLQTKIWNLGCILLR